MDLLFKKYASPFVFMDEMIHVGRFVEFVDDFVKTTNREKEEKINWEFYLHKVIEGTFEDFVAEIEINKKNQNLSQRTIETTIQHSNNILNNFNPEKGGE